MASMQQAIAAVLEPAVGRGEVPGVVAAVADREGILAEVAFGRRALESDQPMTTDTVIWIASMTKALTATAVMQQVEAGRLSLNRPAAEVVPELDRARVLEGFDAAGQPRLRAPRWPITLRHLLTHTSGFSYNTWNAEIGRYMAATDTPPIGSSRLKALTTPLVFDPGEGWEYGIGMDWAGRMVEAVTGRSLGEHLRLALFGPLGMVDTGYRPGPAQRERLAGMHQRGPDGTLRVMDFPVPEYPEFEPGGGGLHSTARDYLAFCRMILNGGRHGGERLLRPETVAEMGRSHIGALSVRPLRSALPEVSNDADFWPGMAQKWGLSFLINTEATPEGRSPGSLAWAGLNNTYTWMDPARGIAGVFLTQIRPFFDAKAVPLFRAFEAAVYRAL